MAKAKNTAVPAPEAVQKGQEPQEVSQDVRELEGLPGAAEGPQEVIGPEDEGELLGCQETSPLEEEPILVTYAVAGCERLRLRELPSVDARILAELPCGAGVLGEAGPPQEGWRWVTTGRLEGWVMDEYLETLGLGMALGDG